MISARTMPKQRQRASLVASERSTIRLALECRFN
jgi:hypothetical protein